MIGLMMRLRAEVNHNYNQLFDDNILAISRTFADYLRLVDIAAFIDERRLTGKLGLSQLIAACD